MHKLGQYADQELLKSLFQNKTPDLRLKYILIQVHAPAGSAVRIKKNRPKGKKVLKGNQTEKKTYKETENSVARSLTWFICRGKQLLDHCTTVTHMICNNNFVTPKQIFSAIDAV